MSEMDVVANFMAMCNCTEEEAIHCLSEANFDLSLAHSVYVAQHASSTRAEAHSPVETSHAGSPGYVTPPYIMGRLDGGADRQDNFTFPSAPIPAHVHQPFAQHQPSGEDLPPLLFPVPAFVHQGTASFSQFCLRALERDQWVLLSVVGDNFKSLCVNRDLWGSEGERELLSMFSIYQINGLTQRGLQVSHGYHLDITNLPVLLIINPLTTMKETQVALPLSSASDGFKSEEVYETLLAFVAERGSPAQWEERKLQRHHPTPAQEEHPQPRAPAPAATPIIVDDEEEAVAGPNRAAHHTPTTRESATRPAPTAAPKAVDISTYEVSASERNAFSLRCRLPKEQMTLRLNPETPTQLLVDYLAYRAYLSEPEAYPQGVPNCTLKAGYPPKEVTAKENIRLANWGDVRSGDNVFLHIKGLDG